MRISTPLLLAPLLAASVGCTSWKLERPAAVPIEPMAAAPPALAKVCVVRTSVLAGAVTFPTHDDDVLVGATRGRGYFCYYAEPGDHVIRIEADEEERATLHAEASKSYFLHEEVDNVFGYVKCRAVWLAPEKAAELVDAVEYRQLVGVPGTERLPGAVTVAPAIAPPEGARSDISRKE